MFLFVGLGNPTEKYAYTRHNIGFMVIDCLVGNHDAFSISKAQFCGELYKSSQNLFLKPLTYMNNSGKSVKAVFDFYKPDEIVVIHDDTAIPFGSIRIKRGGSSGGHNGLKSIDSYLGNDYIRIRIGIGAPVNLQNMADFVLDNFSKEEFACVKKLINYSTKIVEDLPNKDLNAIISCYTSKKGICSDND
ncbi:MAG: aminoacyl-tRNA hydrolase [Campylobacteraceae bacterium]|jgi:PTH1 family peptidyl-tRNA hydrolase|nr:aminoacyl-tRNA hydrolase [Campylobacteraceae bacterium]